MMQKWQTFQWRQNDDNPRYELRSLDPLQPGWWLVITPDWEGNGYTPSLHHRSGNVITGRMVRQFESAKKAAKALATKHCAIRKEM